ncbi:MAG: hypothetical protein ACI8RD_010470, partial [Bacillariaceae sp.]|jgi:hypothetical protein
VTTCRDSHGGIVTQNEEFIHVVDRIQNVVEVFNSRNNDRTTYDLTTGTGTGTGVDAACSSKSIVDDPNLPKNDPSPDLGTITPDGKYIMIGFRGPAPITVAHSSQGSCPGVGIVEITEGGRSGKLVNVIRTTNEIDTPHLSQLFQEEPNTHAPNEAISIRLLWRTKCKAKTHERRN